MAGKKKSKSKASASLLAMVGQVARNARTNLSRHLLDHGLYAGQDAVMLVLDKEDGQAPGAIAQMLGVKAPTITKTISRLSAQGFVRREEAPDDKRMSQVYLTDLGREKIRSVSRAQKETEKQALSGLKNREIKQLLSMLSVIDANLNGSEAPEEENSESKSEKRGKSKKSKAKVAV